MIDLFGCEEKKEYKEIIFRSSRLYGWKRLQRRGRETIGKGVQIYFTTICPVKSSVTSIKHFRPKIKRRVFNFVIIFFFFESTQLSK